jgi:uncharacterized membrane protein YiaA
MIILKWIVVVFLIIVGVLVFGVGLYDDYKHGDPMG